MCRCLFARVFVLWILLGIIVWILWVMCEKTHMAVIMMTTTWQFLDICIGVENIFNAFFRLLCMRYFDRNFNRRWQGKVGQKWRIDCVFWNLFCEMKRVDIIHADFEVVGSMNACLVWKLMNFYILPSKNWWSGLRQRY